MQTYHNMPTFTGVDRDNFLSTESLNLQQKFFSDTRYFVSRHLYNLKEQIQYNFLQYFHSSVNNYHSTSFFLINENKLPNICGSIKIRAFITWYSEINQSLSNVTRNWNVNHNFSLSYYNIYLSLNHYSRLIHNPPVAKQNLPNYIIAFNHI